MQCERVQKELESYLQGTVTPEERAEINAHLSTCAVCSEEATAVKELGQTLRRGLHAWIDQGECPPQLARQIELSIRQGARRPWWRRTWSVYAGASVAAAAVLMIVMWQQPDVAERMASVPLVGAIAAQFISPDLEVQFDPLTPVNTALMQPTRTVAVDGTAEAQGMKLTVEKFEVSPQLTRVRYFVRGLMLIPEIDPLTYQPELSAKDGPVRLRGFNADQRDQGVVFQAYFDPVGSGQALTFTLDRLPVSQAISGRWALQPNGQVDARELPAAGQWQRNGSKVTVTLNWSDPNVLRLTEWTATDSAGKEYAVAEVGRPAYADGAWTQTLTIEAPETASGLELRSSRMENRVIGPWTATFTSP